MNKNAIVQKKKILIVVPSLAGGGAERVLINLLNRFNFNIYEIDLLIGFKAGVYFNEIPENVKVKFLFSNVTIGRSLIHLYKKTGFIYLIRLLINFKIRDCYDAGISFIDSEFTDFLILLRFKIKKKFSFVHASFNSYYQYKKFHTGRYKERLTKTRYTNLDQIIFVSYDARDEFVKVFGDSFETSVIYNILDIEGIKRKSVESFDHYFDSEKVNIIAVGSLIPVKGYDKLIYAAEKLKSDGLDFKISILGTGYLKDNLEKIIESLDLKNQVELLGFRKNPYAFMKRSDVFVMTSLSEALPTALCEALILGIPVVVTDCSGCRELVDSGRYGIMVEQDIEKIYSGLKQIIKNPKIREDLAKKAVERSKIFNDDEVMKEIDSLLRD